MALHHFRTSETFTERSGRLYENDLIGRVDTENKEYRRELNAFLERNRFFIEKRKRKIPLATEEWEQFFNDSIRLVELFPSEDPTHPQKPLLRDLRLAVGSVLGLESDKDLERLKVYSSIGTPLDRFFGVDILLRLESEDSRKRPVYATADLTLNKRKTGTGADLLITELPDPDLEEEKYVREVDSAATQLAAVMLRRSATRQSRRT